MDRKESPQEKYARTKTKVYAFRVVKTTEPDIFEKLESVGNVSGYIKQLIRRDIEQGKAFEK